ncbi:MAG: UDP-2,3-diacylglucosamine diphosphatase LpxI [Desulfarculus sp.]|nr:UDP-2,3-diacylglucosamine diphosphatase LpxI [Desulfarculus sp.]
MPQGSIGLIAGKGQFPILFARAARAAGLRVVAVAIQGETSLDLAAEVDEIAWVKLGQLGKLIKTFQRAGVSRAVMCGGVSKPRMFSDIKPDLKALLLINKLRHMADDGILRTLARVLMEEGIEIVASHEMVPDLLAQAGQYTRRGPDAAERADAELGWQMAGELGKLDIGQAVVVKGKAVVAVEAMEGTDECIRRGGHLAGGERAVVVKRCKPGQDRRFDLPSVGEGTVAVMQKAGASCLVIEAGLTLVFDRQAMVKRADETGICILAWSGTGG